MGVEMIGTYVQVTTGEITTKITQFPADSQSCLGIGVGQAVARVDISQPALGHDSGNLQTQFQVAPVAGPKLTAQAEIQCLGSAAQKCPGLHNLVNQGSVA